MKHLLSSNRLNILNGDGERSSRFGLRLLLLTLVLLLTFAAPVLADDDDGEPVISFTSVNPAKTLLDINGENLHDGSNPTVILGRNGEEDTPVDIVLTVNSKDTDGKQVIANLPDDPNNPGNPLQDGTYLLTIITEDDEAEFHAVLGAVGQNGNAPVMVLLDNSSPPKKMGKVLSITPFAFGVPLFNSPPRGVLTFISFIDSVNEERKVGLFVTPTDIKPKDSLLFLSADCTGQPYLGSPVLDVEFQGTLESIAVHPLGDGVGNFDVTKRALYISKFGATRVERTFKSSIVSTNPLFLGNCNSPLSLKRFSVEAELLDPDLLTTFQPPYTLNISP